MDVNRVLNEICAQLGMLRCKIYLVVWKNQTGRACHSFPGAANGAYRVTGEHSGVKRGRTQRYTTGGKQRENEKCHVYGGQNNKKCFYNILNFLNCAYVLDSTLKKNDFYQ